jgi:hypothetical protein
MTSGLSARHRRNVNSVPNPDGQFRARTAMAAVLLLGLFTGCGDSRT